MKTTIQPGEFPRELAYDEVFTPCPAGLPSSLFGPIGSDELLSAGFRTVRPGEYSKEFSGVLSLDLDIRAQGQRAFRWRLMEKGFQLMLKDLRELNSRLDHLAAWIYQRWVAKGKGPKDPAGWMDDVIRQSEIALRGKRRFFKKYADFLSVTRGTSMGAPYPREYCFFFDWCRTTEELNLWLEFVRLYCYTFGQVKKSTSYDRQVYGVIVRNVITSYYVMLFSIQKARRLWRKTTVSFPEFRRAFPQMSEEILAKAVEEHPSKKGWSHQGFRLAQHHVSMGWRIGEASFRQLLKKERKFASRVKGQLAKEPNIEMFLDYRVMETLDIHADARKTRIPRREHTELIRMALWMIVYDFPEDPRSKKEELLGLMLSFYLPVLPFPEKR